METVSTHENILWLAALGGSWAAWGVLHSLFATYRFQGLVVERLGLPSRGSAAVRLMYNAFAVVSIILPLGLYLYLGGWAPGLEAPSPQLNQSIAEWPSVLLPLQGLLWVSALGLALWAASNYDILAFLGLKDRSDLVSSEEGGILVTTGALGIVRHPWYLSGLILLWARDLSAADLMTNLVLTAYLWAGSLIEENRLVDTFGDEYLEYKRQVPMIMPMPRRIGRRGESRKS